MGKRRLIIEPVTTGIPPTVFHAQQLCNCPPPCNLVVNMSVDKDVPQSWIKFREGLCVSCRATCCKMPVEVLLEDLVRLKQVSSLEFENDEPRHIAKRLIKRGLVRSFRQATGLFLLASRSDGACVFLGKEDLCTEYLNRPDTCRGFPVSRGNRKGYCPYLSK